MEGQDQGMSPRLPRVRSCTAPAGSPQQQTRDMDSVRLQLTPG